LYYCRRGGVVILKKEGVLLLEKGRGCNTRKGEGLYYWKRGGVVILEKGRGCNTGEG